MALLKNLDAIGSILMLIGGGIPSSEARFDAPTKYWTKNRQYNAIPAYSNRFLTSYRRLNERYHPNGLPRRFDALSSDFYDRTGEEVRLAFQRNGLNMAECGSLEGRGIIRQCVDSGNTYLKTLCLANDETCYCTCLECFPQRGFQSPASVNVEKDFSWRPDRYDMDWYSQCMPLDDSTRESVSRLYLPTYIGDNEQLPMDYVLRQFFSAVTDSFVGRGGGVDIGLH